MKRLLIMLVVCSLVAGLPGMALAQGVSISLDGKQLDIGAEPVLAGGRVLVPLRSIFERLGAVVDWNSSLKRVEVQKGSTRIYLPMSSNSAKINGVSYEIDAPARLTNGTTFVPLRFISQALGAAVAWEQATQTVQISSKTAANSKKGWGYYVDAQSLVSLENNLERIGAVLPFSYTAEASGKVRENVYFPQGYNLARQNGLPVYAVIFQDDKNILRELLGSQERQNALIESILSILEERQYQGVNLDFEGIDAENRDSFTALVEALKRHLNPRGYTLSLAVPAKAHDNFSWQKGYDYAALGKAADYLVLMAYDQHYSGSQAGPVAALDWVEQVVNYAVEQVPAEKLILGLGIYGYDWPDSGKGKVVDLSKVDTLKDSSTEVWSELVYSPSLVYTDSSGTKHQVWYEDSRSVASKLELVKKYDLAGFALWRLGIIPSHIWEAIAENN